MIRERILGRLDEALNTMHHQFTVHYTLKGDPKTKHYNVFTFDKKLSKEQAEKMVMDHVAKNAQVQLVKDGLTYKETNRNDSPLDGRFNEFAKYLVIVDHIPSGSKMKRSDKVFFDTMKDPKEIEKKAADQIEKEFKGKILSSHFAGSSKG